MSLSSSKFTFRHALMYKDVSIRLWVPLVSRPQTEKSLSTKACDAGAEITSCATSGTAAHGVGNKLLLPCSTRHQYPELEVVTLSCTGSGSFWHWLHCSMSCFLELVPLCLPALLPDAEIAGQELNRYQHQQLLSLGMTGRRQHTVGSEGRNTVK